MQLMHIDFISSVTLQLAERLGQGRRSSWNSTGHSRNLHRAALQHEKPIYNLVAKTMLITQVTSSFKKNWKVSIFLYLISLDTDRT